MFGIFKKVAPMLVGMAIVLATSAFSEINAGGEIPWPLSVQHLMTVQNSKGLWKLGDGQQSKLYNVEMRADTSSGYDWIRVSELDPETYHVISWGEGYFSPAPGQNAQSSYSDISLDTQMQQDKRGRYLTMYANGDLSSHPYLIRMVEVETTLGNVLGLSIIEYVEKKYDHFLGTREMTDPLSCFESDDKGLTCYLNL